MERRNASEVTYEITSKVSMSGFLAKQTREEEISVGRHHNWCCETAVNMKRSQLVYDN
jgi:primosomal replication protein N